MDDPIAIALKRQTKRVLHLGMDSPPRTGTLDRIGGEHLLLTSL
jgi:hypothetical protein